LLSNESIFSRDFFRITRALSGKEHILFTASNYLPEKKSQTLVFQFLQNDFTDGSKSTLLLSNESFFSNDFFRIIRALPGKEHILNTAFKYLLQKKSQTLVFWVGKMRLYRWLRIHSIALQ
jgi:hypothetical protein